MSNLPNNLDLFPRLEDETQSKNIHKDLHNNISETLEKTQKYSGAIHVDALPSPGVTGTLYTLIEDTAEYLIGTYLCTGVDEYKLISSAGKGIEFRANLSHIQWRYVSETTWTDLVALEDIKGIAGMNWKGAYVVPGYVYKKNDAVYYSGSSYISIQDNNEELPSNEDFWDPLAKGTGGDVFGPDVSVDGRVAEFDGLTGKLLRQAGVKISDIQLRNEKGENNGYASLNESGEVVQHSSHVATTALYGETILSDAIDSESSVVAATSAALKSAYDLADSKLLSPLTTKEDLLVMGESEEVRLAKGVNEESLSIEEGIIKWKNAADTIKIKADTGLIKDEDGIQCDSIDPDNLVALSQAELIGGTNVVLQNFINLGIGDDNGAFKSKIDGVEYDNIGIEMYDIISDPENAGTTETEELSIGSTDSDESFSDDYVFWQTFTMPKNVFIKKVKVYVPGTQSSNVKICLANENDSLESTTALATGSYSGAEERTITLSELVYTGKTQRKFALVVKGNSGLWTSLNTSSSRSYMDGRLWKFNQFVDKDLYLKVLVVDVDGAEFLIDLTSELQTAIRARTSELETVVWDTNKFIISSSISGKLSGSEVLKFLSPTEGTDISGAGYLDLGANATEISSDGDDYRLIRLDANGKIPEDLLPGWVLSLKP